MAVNETLFSLEVAVECMRVSLPTLACRFPTVAFRLLDFPTLLVHHVEPDDTAKVKNSILIDQELNGIPLQLHELKDHKGNFVLKKGKSCMFKMNLATLQTHLCNAPLYVMLVDTWPDVPKLVASCTVSLQDVIQSICNSVQESGIEMPAVHGVRGSYKLYNLMGSEIGWVVLGLRLLSLGGSLMPHIPQASLVTRQSSKDGSMRNKNFPLHGPKTVDHVVVENLDVAATSAKRSTQSTYDVKQQLLVTSATTNPDEADKRNQVPVESSATQTESLVKSKRKSHKQLKHVVKFPAESNLLQDINGLIISNTHCPPPLYFNADIPVNRDDIESSHKTDHTINKPICDDERDLVHNELINTSIISSITSSEATSVSSREQYTETHYQYQSEAAGKMQTLSVRKTHRRQTAKHQGKSAPKINPGGDSDDVETVPANLLNHSQMPILTALLQELSLLHGGSLPHVSPTVQPDPSSPSDHKRDRKQSMTIGRKGNLVKPEFSNPKQRSPYRHKHEECEKTPHPVPSKKSWLRKEPKPTKPNKTKLRYGMTNTQKLRLRKNNPTLLKYLEEQEAKVQSYRQSLTEKVQQKERKVATINSEVNDFDVSTEISHHPNQPSKTHGVSLQRETRDDPSGSEEVTHNVMKKRRPVPSPRTPRAIGGATFKWNNADRVHEDKQSQHAESNDTNHSDELVELNDQTEDDRPEASSDKSVKSGRSIDVYLPTSVMDESFQENEELLQESPQLPYKSVAGFPSIDLTLQSNDEQASPSLNLTNFDSSKNFESSREQDIPPLSQSFSTKSENQLHDFLEESHSIGSFSSEQSKSSRVSAKGITDQPQPATRYHTGLSLPKPLISTKSPVPLAIRRSSRPSLQIQVPSDIQETHGRKETQTPPTPKPRRNIELTGSTKSSENLSTSEFSSKDNSDRDYGARLKRENLAESYSEDFNSSDSN